MLVTGDSLAVPPHSQSGPARRSVYGPSMPPGIPDRYRENSSDAPGVQWLALGTPGFVGPRKNLPFGGQESTRVPSN